MAAAAAPCRWRRVCNGTDATASVGAVVKAFTRAILPRANARINLVAFIADTMLCGVILLCLNGDDDDVPIENVRVAFYALHTIMYFYFYSSFAVATHHHFSFDVVASLRHS